MQMRQVKAFMKAKKPMWRCGECKCITLQCRKENDEFCNCGESVLPLMSYSELQEYASSHTSRETSAMLNEYPVEYFDKYNKEWHMEPNENEGLYDLIWVTWNLYFDTNEKARNTWR